VEGSDLAIGQSPDYKITQSLRDALSSLNVYNLLSLMATSQPRVLPAI
jgi:hypothetical protein